MATLGSTTDAAWRSTIFISCGYPVVPTLKAITLENLIRGERLADELTAQEAAAMMTALAGVQLALANRILTARAPEQAEPDESQLLSVDEVATLIQTSREGVYRLSNRRDWLPFTVRISRKRLRFREAGFKKWLASRANLKAWEAHR